MRGGFAPSPKSPLPQARNTSPYYGEGERGGEVRQIFEKDRDTGQGGGVAQRITMAKSKVWMILLIAASLLVVSIVFVGGCAEEPSPPVVPDTIPLEPTPDIYIPIGEFQNQPQIDVAMHAVVGEELVVTLDSNPTTGYQWSEDAEIWDETIIRQVSHQFVEPGIDKPPGTPAKEVWIFKGLKKGTTTIILEYSRPWIEEDIGHWTVTITANIK